MISAEVILAKVIWQKHVLQLRTSATNWREDSDIHVHFYSHLLKQAAKIKFTPVRKYKLEADAAHVSQRT